jgi:ribose transport system permease protein
MDNPHVEITAASTSVRGGPGGDLSGSPERRTLVSRHRIGLLLESYSLLLVMGLVIAFFSLWSETSATFPTSANVQTIIGNQSVLAIAALAAVVPLVCGQFDLSIGANLGLTSIAAATMFSDYHWGIPMVVVVSILIGASIGAINGLLVTKFRINALIVTLGMATILTSLVTWKTHGQSIVSGIPHGLVQFGTGNSFGIPRTLFILLGVAGIVWYLLDLTPMGRYLYSVGANPRAASLVGLGVDRLMFASFVLAGALAGAAGVLQLSRSGAGNPVVGENFTLPALAAAFLSASSVKPGKYNVPGTLIAIFLLAALTSGLNLAGVEGWISGLVNGLALIIGVGLSSWLQRRQGRETV